MNKLLVEKYGTRLHVHTLLLQSGGGGGRDAKATKLTLRIVVFWVERISCLSPVCRMRICARLDPATAGYDNHRCGIGGPRGSDFSLRLEIWADPPQENF